MRHPRPEGKPETQGTGRRAAGDLRQGRVQATQSRGMQLERPEAMAVLATRYDKLALTYRSVVVLQAVVIWSAAISY